MQQHNNIIHAYRKKWYAKNITINVITNNKLYIVSQTYIMARQKKKCWLVSTRFEHFKE